jgi:hypothetical protein
VTESEVLDEIVPETEEEAEMGVQAATLGAETIAMGLVPIEMMPSDPSTRARITVQRLRRVRGVRRARLAQEGEYDPDEWPGDETEHPIMVDSGSGLWTLLAVAVGGVIWILWSLFDTQLISRDKFGRKLPDDDLIAEDVRDGTAGFLTLNLRTVDPVTWLKALEVRDVKNTVRMRIYTEGNRRRDRVLVQNSELRGACLVFWKAKFGGIHKNKYVLGGLQEYENKEVTLTWKKDAAWHW